MSESCNCVEVRCCSDNPFNYSLVAGTVYENDQVAIEFECPPGLRCTPGTYVIPRGRIRFTPTNTESGTLRLLCCESEIVRAVPVGSTPEEVGVIAQSMANDCARQLARCTAAQTIRFGSTKYSDEVCYNGCANQGLQLGWLASPPTFPSVIFFNQGSLCLRAGAFASQDSISAATASAQTFLQNYVTSLLFQGVLDCGYWNEEGICGDGITVIPAYTSFSAISQEDANQKAEDEICLEPCPAVFASIAYSGTATQGQSIQGRGSDSAYVYQCLNAAGMAKIDTATNTLVYQFSFPTSVFGVASRSDGILLVFSTSAYYVFDPSGSGSILSTQTYPGTISLTYIFATPWNDAGGYTTVVGRGNIGPGNRDHIIKCSTSGATVAYSSPSSFNEISAPGSYDPTRDQYNYKVLNSTTFPVGPERIVTFSSAFAIVNSAVVAGIHGGDGLIYCSGNDSLYYYGRNNSTGNGLYQVNPSTLAFGGLILGYSGFPSGALGYGSTTGILAVRQGLALNFVDTSSNTIVCTGALSLSNNLVPTISTEVNKAYVVGAAGFINAINAPN